MILRKLYKLLEKTGPRSLFVRSATEYALGLFYFLRMGREPKQRFAIYMQGRSGSSFFCDLIDQHPQVRCNTELLNNKCNNPYDFLRNISYYYGKNYPVWGFKFKNYQMDMNNISSVKDFLEYLSKERYKIICLTRNNSLRVSLSMWIGHRRGEQYHNTGEAEKRQKVSVTPEEVMRVIEQNENILHEMKESLKNIDALELVYEEDLDQPGKAAASCQKVFHLLGVDPMEVQSKFKKVSTGRLSDDLENAEEIYEFIKNSKYAHFLEGVSL